MVDANTAQQTWSIRPCKDGDEGRIRVLRGIALSGPKSYDWWKWQFLNNPAGAAIICLAEANGMVVGHHAILPIRMKLGEETANGSLSVDGMTHPDFQRRGIFGAVARKTYEDARSQGLRITYGVPNPLTYPINIEKLQWFDVCPVPVLVKVLSWGGLIKRRLGIPGRAAAEGFQSKMESMGVARSRSLDIEVEQVPSFDNRADRLWLKASAIKSLMVVRDQRYLNWRYAAKPGREYRILTATSGEELLGYIVLKLAGGRLPSGFIVDMLALPGQEATVRVLIEKAVTCFRKEGAVTVACWMLQGVPYYGVLRKLGFIRRSSRWPLMVRINDAALSRELVSDPDKWYFTWGDMDTI